MKSLRSQVSLEYLLFAGVMLTILIPVFSYALSTTNQHIRTSQANELVQRVAETADSLYSIGPGSQDTITVIVPGGVENITVKGNEINIKLNIFNSISDIYAVTKPNLTGNISKKSGTYHLSIRVFENGTVDVR